MLCSLSTFIFLFVSCFFSFLGFSFFKSCLELTASEFSIVAKTLPSETLSPILTFRSLIFPSDGEGTSTLDLSLSIVTTGSFFFI